MLIDTDQILTSLTQDGVKVRLTIEREVYMLLVLALFVGITLSAVGIFFTKKIISNG